MDKYVIEIPSGIEWIQFYEQNKSGVHGKELKNIGDLTPYTEPDEDEIRQKAREEVWEFASDICHNRGNILDILKFRTATAVFDAWTYSEAKAKYEEWRKQKDEIRVGYEVEYPPNKAKGIVIQCHVPDVYAEVDKYAVFTGTSVEHLPIEWLTKTGRVFPEVAELLEKMRKE